MLNYAATSMWLFVSNSIQLALGCVAAAILVRIGAAERLGRFAGRSAASALCGAIFPLGIFGALPIASTALVFGIGEAPALAFLVSNSLFNTLVPFTDPTFIWRTGYPRVILAVAAGMVAAVIVEAIGARPQASGHYFLRDRPRPTPPRAIAVPAGKRGFGAGLRYVLAWIAEAWPYAAVGALAGTAFLSYGLGAIMNFMFTNPLTSALPYVFAQADVTNPFFLLTTRILMTLTDFPTLAAFAAVLKIRGIIAFFLYFGLLAALLGATAFL